MVDDKKREASEDQETKKLSLEEIKNDEIKNEEVVSEENKSEKSHADVVKKEDSKEETEAKAKEESLDDPTLEKKTAEEKETGAKEEQDAADKKEVVKDKADLEGEAESGEDEDLDGVIPYTGRVPVDYDKKDQAKAVDKEKDKPRKDPLDRDYYPEKSKASRIAGIIGNLIFVLVILSLLSVTVVNVTSFITGKHPSILGRSMIIIDEDSMRPTLDENDAIVVKAVESNQVQQGDLMIYESRTGGKLITGWVTKVLPEDKFQVKKHLDDEEYVVIEGIAVLGTASYILRNVGGFINFLTHPVGILSLILVLTAIYLGLSWYRKKKQEKMPVDK